MYQPPDRRVRVIVSSTLQELAAERAASRGAITGLHLAQVMFELGARPPHPAREFYRAYLAQTEVPARIYQGPHACVRGASTGPVELGSRSGSRVTFTSLLIRRTRRQFAATAELEDAQMTGGVPRRRVMIGAGFPYFRAQPWRNVEALLWTPAAAAAASRDCGKVRSFCLTACAHGPFFRAGAP